MKFLFLFMFSWFSLHSWANEIKVELNPTKPIAGQVFQAYFRIFTDLDEEPVINFNPYNLEVVNKANQGVTTRTMYSNGQLTTSREMTIVYDLIANRVGAAGIRDIRISLGNQNLRYPAVNFNVLKEPEVAGDVFLMADVPKKRLFIGEGIVVRYYLYSKVPVSNLDIKKYPKLEKFLKRFLQEPERSERVNVDGEIYLRTQIYAAKLFPEKPGVLKIDPMHMSVSAVISRGNDPFGNFGFGREMRNKTLSSEMTKIEVMPLPEIGKPDNFTGLVGKHEFEISVGQSKLIVNEPLEIKLTVTGGGALENMEAPDVISLPGLEEFEANGDLKITNADLAVKTFEYTYLAKSEFIQPPRTLGLSYFDPDSMKYVQVDLSLPSIQVIGGGQAKASSNQENDKHKTQTSTVDNSLKSMAHDEDKIILKSSDLGVWRFLNNYLNTVLMILVIILVSFLSLRTVQFPRLGNHSIPRKFKKGEFALNEFVAWINPLIEKTGKSPMSIIRESALSVDSKAYFIDILSSNDYKDYSEKKESMNFKYNSDYFKELDQYIKSVDNENYSELT